MSQTLTLMAVGDIGPVCEPADPYAELVAPVLAQADVRLGQCERTYSNKGYKPNYDNGPRGNQITCSSARSPGAASHSARSRCE